MLRGVIAAAALLALVCGLVLLVMPGHAGLGLLIFGALVLLSLFFEGRYNRSRSAPPGTWEPTGEKFIDPGTGKFVEVDYDPQTGERNYRQS